MECNILHKRIQSTENLIGYTDHNSYQSASVKQSRFKVSELPRNKVAYSIIDVRSTAADPNNMMLKLTPTLDAGGVGTMRLY